MLRIVQFDNGRYGLQNELTGIVIDKEWRTLWGVRYAARKRTNKFVKTLGRLQKMS